MLLLCPIIAIIIMLPTPKGDSMEFHDYQSRSRKTAKYPAIGHPLIYPALGLVNKAGEYAIIQKV